MLFTAVTKTIDPKNIPFSGSPNQFKVIAFALEVHTNFHAI